MADASELGSMAGLLISIGLIVTLIAWATGIGASNDFGGSIGCGCCSSIFFILIFAIAGITDL